MTRGRLPRALRWLFALCLAAAGPAAVAATPVRVLQVHDAIGPVHAGTAVTAMVMSGLVIIGLVMRPQGRVLRVTSWISIALLSTYLINVALLHLSGA